MLGTGSRVGSFWFRKHAEIVKEYIKHKHDDLNKICFPTLPLFFFDRVIVTSLILTAICCYLLWVWASALFFFGVMLWLDFIDDVALLHWLAALTSPDICKHNFKTSYFLQSAFSQVK